MSVDNTRIEWTDATWNPVTGCSKVSAGCKHCYAETVAMRLWRGRRFTEVRCHPERLDQPLRWARPRRIFVNSMSDLFHEDVPDEFIGQVFTVCSQATQHCFQVLTKRPQRMRWLAGEYELAFRPNIWLGVSVEDQETVDARIPILLQTLAAVRFLSVEPLLGPADIRAYLASRAIDWVIVGGESGPGARPCDVAWIRGVVEQCRDARVACFVKQLGGAPVMDEGAWRAARPTPLLAPRNRARVLAGTVPLYLRDRKGGDPAEWPHDLRAREYP